MSTPFDKVNGEPLNLSLQSHRDKVIERNKILANAIQNGLGAENVNTSIVILFEFNCVKCGSHVSRGINEKIIIDDCDIEKIAQSSSIPCSCCQTKYRYDRENFNFTVVVPNPIINAVKIKQ